MAAHLGHSEIVQVIRREVNGEAHVSVQGGADPGAFYVLRGKDSSWEFVYKGWLDR